MPSGGAPAATHDTIPEMRYCRFRSSDRVLFGLIESRSGVDVITRAAFSPAQWEEHEDFDPVPLADATLVAPVTPSKIICVGRNYSDHARELGHDVPMRPLIFLKPPSAILRPGGEIIRPPGDVSQRVDFEGELAVVIDKACHLLAEGADTKPYIRGYTIANDVTARDLQAPDGQWTRAKGFDTFCPVGPMVSDEIDPANGVALETRLNGEVKQRGNTRDFIFSLDAIIRFISQVMTLLPGDLLLTGTPAGVAPMQAGDVVEVSIAGIGTLRNSVV